MKEVILIALVALCGCNNQALPGENLGDGGMSFVPDDGGNTSNPNPMDLSMSQSGTGMVGAMCSTACDCVPGLACFMNKCTMSMLGKLYCCDDVANCPAGSFCQPRSGGRFQQCGMPTNPMPRDMGGGGGGYCRFIPCSSATVCMQSGCGACGANGNCTP